MWEYVSYDELYHHGVKGMKWGVRRYQKQDGSLTNAGKRRLAKSIQKAAKDASYEGRNQLKDDIVNDLTKNYKGQIKTHIQNIQNARKKWKEIDKPENDYWDSGAAAKDSALAYKQTIDWFKKNNKQYLDTIIKNNGGKTTDLDGFHDFRKTYEAFEDSAWSKGGKRFYKEKGIDPDQMQKAFDNYVDTCTEAAKDILGKYGKMSVKNIHVYGTQDTVQSLVESSLMRIAND